MLLETVRFMTPLTAVVWNSTCNFLMYTCIFKILTLPEANYRFSAITNKYQ